MRGTINKGYAANTAARRQQEFDAQQEAFNAQLAAAMSGGMSAPSVVPTLLEESKAATIDAMSTASQNAQRQQMLRKGLMSLFTRYSDNAGRARTSAPNLSAKATKLGG